MKIIIAALLVLTGTSAFAQHNAAPTQLNGGVTPSLHILQAGVQGPVPAEVKAKKPGHPAEAGSVEEPPRPTILSAGASAPVPKVIPATASQRTTAVARAIILPANAAMPTPVIHARKSDAHPDEER